MCMTNCTRSVQGVHLVVTASRTVISEERTTLEFCLVAFSSLEHDFFMIRIGCKILIMQKKTDATDRGT